jgi:hypothetical protein
MFTRMVNHIKDSASVTLEVSGTGVLRFRRSRKGIYLQFRNTRDNLVCSINDQFVCGRGWLPLNTDQPPMNNTHSASLMGGSIPQWA